MSTQVSIRARTFDAVSIILIRNLFECTVRLSSLPLLVIDFAPQCDSNKSQEDHQTFFLSSSRLPKFWMWNFSFFCIRFIKIITLQVWKTLVLFGPVGCWLVGISCFKNNGWVETDFYMPVWPVSNLSWSWVTVEIEISSAARTSTALPLCWKDGTSCFRKRLWWTTTDLRVSKNNYYFLSDRPLTCENQG